jgi:hypothetical protein
MKESLNGSKSVLIIDDDRNIGEELKNSFQQLAKGKLYLPEHASELRAGIVFKEPTVCSSLDDLSKSLEGLTPAWHVIPKLSDSCRPNVHLRIKEESVSALLVECWTERPNCLIRTLFSPLNAATRIKEAVLVHTPPVAITDRWVSR